MIAKKLGKSSIVGVCAPSGDVGEEDLEKINNTENLLKVYGINTKYSDNLTYQSVKYSDKLLKKIEDLNSLIKDKNTSAIIFARGGNTCNSLLDKIDYDAIKSNPKIFVGLSDNTILLNAIYKKCELVTYHFENFKRFCNYENSFNKKQFVNVFIKGQIGEVEKDSEWKTIRSGKAEGILVGGSLGSLVKILNTEYCPDFEGKILFIEELSFESDIDQLISSIYLLKQNEVFERISGLLIGNYESDKANIEDIVLDIVKEYDFPILKCDDFGHIDRNIVLAIGANFILDDTNTKLIYTDKILEE